MGLNFYIGRYWSDLNFHSDSTEFDDEFQNDLYLIRDQVSFDLQPLYDIDPYNDTYFNENDMKRIITSCENLLISNTLKEFDDEATDCIIEIKELFQKGLDNGEGIFAIGD